MVSRVIGAIAIAIISFASVFGEPPVELKERHLRALSEDQLRLQQQQQQDDSSDGRYGWEDSVPGAPGRDYPNLTSIPETSFSCAGKTAGGYYADVETRCQVFHVCSTQGLKSSFLCPSGSIFNQRHFVCDWWYDFICEQALELYSLNDALNDPNSSTDPTVTPSSNDDKADRYNQLPLAPVQFNSISAGSNADLSLASSGYTNNLRDEANLIYEDYSNGKILEKPAPTPSGISDNYSDARRKESAQNYEESQTQQQPQQQQHRQPIYRRRPSQGPDNVPRGFSKPPPSSDESREFKRGDQAPGFFVNNGLSDGFKDQNYQLAGENNNFIDNSNYYRHGTSENLNYYNRNTINNNNNNNINNNNNNNNNYNLKVTNSDNNNFNTRNLASNSQNYNGKVTNGETTNLNSRNVAIDNANYNGIFTTSESTNFNARKVAINTNNYNNQVTTESTNINSRNVANNNGNFNNIAYTETNNNNNNQNDYQNFYQNVQYPLPQENNNYDNNFNQNLVGTERQNENYYKAIRIYSSEYTNKFNENSNRSFTNSVNYDNNYQNFDSTNYNTENSYNNNQNVNNNVNYNQDNSNNRNTGSDNNYKNNFEADYTKPIHVESTTIDYNLQDNQYETTINPDFLINASPSEEEVDRETQRQVDSVDLKRQRPPPYSRQYTDTYTSPPGFLIREETSWRDDLSTSSSGSQSPPFPPERVGSESTPTLPRPEETTTPVTISARRPTETPKYLGRRPAGGLSSGVGNGLPGANKNLVASNAITGKPNDESSTNSIPSADDIGNGYSTYRPPQGFTATPGQESYNDAGYRSEGQYWNDNRDAWNDGARYNSQRY